MTLLHEFSRASDGSYLFQVLRYRHHCRSLWPQAPWLEIHSTHEKEHKDRSDQYLSGPLVFSFFGFMMMFLWLLFFAHFVLKRHSGEMEFFEKRRKNYFCFPQVDHIFCSLFVFIPWQTWLERQLDQWLGKHWLRTKNRMTCREMTSRHSSCLILNRSSIGMEPLEQSKDSDSLQEIWNSKSLDQVVEIPPVPSHLMRSYVQNQQYSAWELKPV